MELTTKLTEFKNKKNNTLRGIETLPNISTDNSITIFLHGFERTATTEPFSKRLADKLALHKKHCIRFDFTGCGLSDGNFKQTTIDTMLDDYLSVTKKIKKSIEINIVTHSVSACVVAKLAKNKMLTNVSKIVLISPALNQKDLLRYWFTSSYMRKVDKSIEITWNNYKEYLNEKELIKDTERKNRLTKANLINSDYFIKNREIDYSKYLENTTDKILHVHGDYDFTVPIESLNINFNSKIIVHKGDHYIQKPPMFNQWADRCVKFLCN